MYSNIYNKSNKKYSELQIQTFFNDGKKKSMSNQEAELKKNLENITNQSNIIFDNVNKISKENSGGSNDLSILKNIKSKLENLDNFNASEHGKFISLLFEICNDEKVLNCDFKKYKENPAESDKKLKEIISKYKYDIVLGVNKNNTEENIKKLQKYIDQKKNKDKAPNNNSNNNQGNINNNQNNGQMQNNNQNNQNNYNMNNKFENPNSFDDNDFNILGNDNKNNSNSESNNNNYNFNNGNKNYNNGNNSNNFNNGSKSYNNNNGNKSISRNNNNNYNNSNNNNNYNKKNNNYNSYNNNYNNNQNNNNSYGKSFYGNQISYNNNKFQNPNSVENGYKEENINYVEPNQYDNNQDNSQIKLTFIYNGNKKDYEIGGNENSELISYCALEMKENPKIYCNGNLIESDYYKNKNVKDFVAIFGSSTFNIY